MSFANTNPKDFILATFIGMRNIFTAWMPYVQSGDTTYPSLRRAAIAIWINSLVEFIEKKAERTVAIAALNQTGSCPPIIVQRIYELEVAAVQILSHFSESEQICLWYVRNQSVHGHLSLYFRDDLGVPIFDSISGLVSKRSFTRAYIDAATAAIENLKPMQRLSPYSESNPLLNPSLNVLGDEAIDEYHRAMFGNSFA